MDREHLTICKIQGLDPINAILHHVFKISSKYSLVLYMTHVSYTWCIILSIILWKSHAHAHAGTVSRRRVDSYDAYGHVHINFSPWHVVQCRHIYGMPSLTCGARRWGCRCLCGCRWVTRFASVRASFKKMRHPLHPLRADFTHGQRHVCAGAPGRGRSVRALISPPSCGTGGGGGLVRAASARDQRRGRRAKQGYGNAL